LPVGGVYSTPSLPSSKRFFGYDVHGFTIMNTEALLNR